jgi:adenylate cyclase
MRYLTRFPDLLAEADYVRTERVARVVTTRVLVLLGILTVMAIAVSNFTFMSGDVALVYAISAAVMISVMLMLFGATFLPAYPTVRWWDLALFTAMTIAGSALVWSLWGSQERVGFTNSGMAVIILATFLMFASIGFVANARQFLVWAILFYIGVLIWLLTSDFALSTRIYAHSSLGTFVLFSMFVNLDLDRRARTNFVAHRELAAERRKSEELLYNVLPESVAARLKAGETVADAIPRLTVIFVDMVGFSVLARRLPAEELVSILNRFFTAADECAAAHQVEKVKTIGDAYLAVAGGLERGGGEAEAIAFARDLIGRTRYLSELLGVDLKVRAGIHSGPVVGGVIGSSRLAYDYWGDTMNVASRIEGIAEVNGIAVSSSTAAGANGSAHFSGPERIVLKGVGETEIYRVRS